REDTLHAGVQQKERLGQSAAAKLLRRRLVRSFRVNVLDQVGVHALAVADRGLEADGILDEIEQFPDALLGKAALLRELFLGWLAVVLLGELAARAHEPSDL